MTLIDLTPAQLAARLDRQARSAGWPWGDLLTMVRPRPEGVVSLASDGVGGPIRFGVCWWTDRLGRRHWAFTDEGGGEGEGEAVLGGWCLRWRPTCHPLEWIAGPLTGGWRERGGRREFVVVCRCGEVGTPEALAWMGTSCGPCFDREQEGIPPAGPAVCRAREPCHQLLPSPCGRLLVVSPGNQGSSAAVVVAAYAPPWDRPPDWRRRWGRVQSVAATGSLVAVAAGGGVELLDARDGETGCRLAPGHWVVVAVAFADPERVTPVTLHPDGVRFWDAALTRPIRTAALRNQPALGLTVSPDGRRVAAFTGAGVEVFEVATGKLVEAFISPAHSGSRGAWGADGSFFVARRGPWTSRLDRWGAASGRLARVLGWDRWPDASLDGIDERVVAAEAGVVLTGGRSTLTLHDAPTLAEVASFTVGGGDAGITDVAFVAGGRLLVGSERGIAVWPWRELFGVGA